MVELLHIDCMEYMAGLPDKAFDLAIVDPEYGLNIAKRAFLGGGNNGHSVAIQKNGRKISVKHKEYKVKSWDKQRASIGYFKELFRVSKNQIIWGGNYFADILPPSSGWIFWDKQQSANYSDGELAWTSFPVGLKKFTVRWNGMIQYDMANKEDRIHPTQKPIPLYKKTIGHYAKSADKILDTHLGSGSSAIAAHSMGFDFVGCELDKDYYEAACKRFKEQTAQQKLFQ